MIFFPAVKVFDSKYFSFLSLIIDNFSTNNALNGECASIKLKNFYEVDEFRCRLRGNERDQAFQSNNEYFVEYIFPSVGFIDESFAPWDFNYVNPHINIIRLEVCDERHQILRNPNFLEHQSLLINNDFDNSTGPESTLNYIIEESRVNNY